ncbi:hypothetical protein HKX48_006934 [Thoreauomyces humboldtii]|nr:hypothetical protein HKX48_006934 [Thoreauomyces humboldtii]
MHFSTALTTVAALVASAVPALAQTPAGCPVVGDVNCLASTAQYTVLATVISNNANTTATPANYNATISISCVYTSAGANQGKGTGMIGSDLTVTGFGNPKAACPSGVGADAIVGSTGIMFISVGQSVGPNVLPFYTLFNPCGGAVANSTANLQTIRNVITANPTDSIVMGTCALPPAPPASSSASSAGAATAAASPSTVPLTLPGASTGSGAGSVEISQYTILSLSALGLVGVLTAAFA